ncbi:MAG TPA: ferredoxin family protein [Pirellulales bacterium]|nr:ferredoxin family protein [Pirellulales bacterium]
MAKNLTVVISQGQSANPAKRKLEEEIVAGLLFERGLEVTVIPHLYDLAPDGTGMLCLQGIAGDMVVLSWLYSRAAHWTMDRNGIRGRVGTILLTPAADDDDDGDDDDEEALDAENDGDEARRVEDSRPVPNRSIYCLDLRARDQAAAFIEEVRRIQRESAVETVGVGLMNWIGGAPKPEPLARYLQPAETNVAGNGHAVTPQNPNGHGALPKPLAAPHEAFPQSAIRDPQSAIAAAAPVRIDEPTNRRWYPVIDYSRCTNCLECLDFCLFGVYGVGTAETILVEQPDNCRKGCPACSRVCPENAIIFPQHKTPAIAGSPDGAAGGLKIDLSKLFGAPDALEVAVIERDVELVAVGRDAVGMEVGIPKRQSGQSQAPKDELDNLIDTLDELDL